MARSPSEYREPRTYFGHPLTPQKVPLDKKAREEAVRQIQANDEAVANPVILEHLIAQNELLQHIRHAMQPAAKRILFSGLAQLDNTGVWSHRAGGGIASGALWIYSPSVPLVVTTGTRQAAPPNFGPGVFLVPANESLTLNAHTEEWTIYGNGTAGGLTAVVPAPATATNPAVYVVPAEMTLETVTTTLATSAPAGNRYVVLTIRDPSGNLIFATAGGAEPGGFGAVSYQFSSAPPANVGGTTLGIYEGPLPAGLTLQAGSTLTITTNGLQAGDQYGASTISGNGESLGPATSSAGALVNVTVFSDHQALT